MMAGGAARCSPTSRAARPRTCTPRCSPRPAAAGTARARARQTPCSAPTPPPRKPRGGGRRPRMPRRPWRRPLRRALSARAPDDGCGFARAAGIVRHARGAGARRAATAAAAAGVKAGRLHRRGRRRGGGGGGGAPHGGRQDGGRARGVGFAAVQGQHRARAPVVPLPRGAGGGELVDGSAPAKLGKEPVAKDDVLEVMRQLEQQNSRTTRSRSSSGGGGPGEGRVSRRRRGRLRPACAPVRWAFRVFCGGSAAGPPRGTI